MEQDKVIAKAILYFGKPCAVACDARCDKAWGINGRPQVRFDKNDDDDTAYLPDNELGIAPDDPGTYEGGQAKPTSLDQRLNKWCVRECERSEMAGLNELIELPDFSTLLYNQPWKHTAERPDSTAGAEEDRGGLGLE